MFGETCDEGDERVVGGAVLGGARETRADEVRPRGVPRARTRDGAAGRGRGARRHEVHDEADAVHVALGRRARAAVELGRRPRVGPAHRCLCFRNGCCVSKVSVACLCVGWLVVVDEEEMTNPSLSLKESPSGQMKQFSGLMSRCR